MTPDRRHSPSAISAQRRRPFTKKYLGQNFLINQNVKMRLIRACHISPEETILEIGPGLGALTGEILKLTKNVYAIETDRNLYENLRTTPEFSGLHLVHGDFLKTDLSFLPERTKVIGNLPYNISTPIIEKCIACRKHFSDLFFTVQWEFGKRLAARINSKDYGALSCFVQYYCDPKILFKIPNTCFRPVPRVMSCFVHLPFIDPAHKAIDEKALFDLIRHAFQQRRKKIINALSGIIEKDLLAEILSRAEIHPDLRAENLSLKNFTDMTNLWCEKRGGI